MGVVPRGVVDGGPLSTIRDYPGFTVIDRLGSGGVADVFRARVETGSNLPGEFVAIKVLREPDRSAGHVRRFLREGLLLHRLRHPGLPRCFRVVEGPSPYLVLELLQGETLAARLRREGALDPGLVLQLADAVLEVLEHLHQLGIAHRDLKPGNIHLGEDGRVRLLDLGLATDHSSGLQTTLGEVLGTFAYMAPEQLAGAEVDARADLYSLGVTLHEALSGVRPAARGLERGHVEDAGPALGQLRPEAPSGLVDTIARLMARDPLGRPPSAAIARALLTGQHLGFTPLRRPPLTGRAAAVGAIEAILDDPRAVALVGEPGSGAARVCDEALRMARARGMEALSLRCRTAAHPLDPVYQLIERIEAEAGTVGVDPQDLARAVEAWAAEQDALLVIEDAEHCSAAAAILFERLRRLAPRLRILFSGTRAPVGLELPRCELRPLRPGEVDEVIGGLLGTRGGPTGLAPRLHAITGGLPALVVATVKELVENGQLTRARTGEDGEPRWAIDPSTPLSPRSSVERVFGAVLRALDPEALRVLEVVSVAGDALPLRAALALADADPAGVSASLLVAAQLVSLETHADGEWVVPRRPAVSALLAAGVERDRQAAIHREVARTIRSLPVDPWRERRAAWHDAFGASPEAAPRLLLELGESLSAEGQPDAALVVLDRAGRLPGAEAVVSARLSVARGEALVAAHRRLEARQGLEAGRKFAARLGAGSLQARAVLGLAQIWQLEGDQTRSVQLLEEALQLCRGDPQDPSTPRILLSLGDWHRLAGRPGEAESAYERARAAARETGDGECEALLSGGIAVLRGEAGRLEDALRLFEAESQWMRANRRMQALVQALYRQAICLRRLGRFDEAEECLDEAEEAARFAAHPYGRALAILGRASLSLAAGDFAIAQVHLGHAGCALDEDASHLLRLTYRDLQVEHRLALGDLQATLAICQIAGAEAQRAGHLSMTAFFHGLAGVLTADPAAVVAAVDQFAMGGDRRLAARLLLQGALLGGDREVLLAAETEARGAQDRLLLLRILHHLGGSERRAEAAALAREVLRRLPSGPREAFIALPAVRWANA
jgi:tetratricopeptide (TPR) repeat protein